MTSPADDEKPDAAAPAVRREELPEDLIAVEEAPARQVLDDSFVLTATGISHQIRGAEKGLSLLVQPADRNRAEHELDLYHHESRGWPIEERQPLILPKALASLVGFVIVVVGFFLFQNLNYNSTLIDRAGSSVGIVQNHEWWRAITALFLHADDAHLIGNLFLGFGLAWYLVRLVGPGLTWAGFLVSGAIGNALNAYFYRHSPHLAIGLSTAVFGAAGVWTGFNFFEGLRENALIRWRKMIVPVGAGLAFLVIWGASPETDYMAHFWGALTGFVYGIAVARFEAHRRIGRIGQFAVSLGVLAIIAAAWAQVLR